MATNFTSGNDLGEALIYEFDQISGNRGVWESHWEEIAERVLPAYSNLFTSRGERVPGEKRTSKQYTATPGTALTRFSAAMESMLTPRTAKWHRLVPNVKELMKDRETQLYFEAVNDLLFQYRYAPKANFASQNHQNYIGLGAFGTGCLFTDELDSEPGLRYRAVHLGEIYFAENHQGIIDKAYRRFEMTARQMKQKWGEDKLPDQIKQKLGTQPETKFWVLHCVKPREDLDPTRLDYKGMAFASYYTAFEGKKVLSEGGYNTFPYSISRYVQIPGELYGRSPAMEALPAIKTLNEQKKTYLKQGHRVVDPVLLTHDDGILDSFSLRPGALNSGGVTADGRPLVHALPTGSLAWGEKMMDQERLEINDAFLVTLFQILVETPQMTATEVLERAREKGALLSPTMGRQQSEYLGPTIERELDLLARQGILPPMPPLLQEAGGEFKVEYDSPLSRAQKAEEASGLFRSLELGIAHFNATQSPEALDWIDIDAAMPAVMEINAVPASWQRSWDQVQAIRKGRAEQAQERTMIEAGPAAAAMLKAGAAAQKQGTAK